jgi:4-hydroxy-tetrahydrodipicolinate reductase
VIEHPQLDLVGLYVYAAEKEGKDAGELAGLDVKTGILATRDINKLLATKPDCVTYMPAMDGHSFDDMCRILESGINIVTVVNKYHHGPTLPQEKRRRLEAAFKTGGASLYATGASPGFITEIFPLAAMMLQRRLDRFAVKQFSNLMTADMTRFIADWFGGDPAKAAKDGLPVPPSDGDSLRALADMLSVPLDDVTTRVDVAATTKTVQNWGRTYEAGTVGAWRQTAIGMRGGKPLLEYSRTMYISTDLDPGWDVRHTGWHVVMEGDTSLDIEMRFPLETYNAAVPGYTANPAVNSVPAVCDAPPGLLRTADLRLAPNFATASATR